MTLSVSVADFARLIDGQVVRSSPVAITGVADPETAQADQATFFLERLPTPTGAGLVITQTKQDCPGTAAHITVAQPRVAFAYALAHFHPEPIKRPPVGIHPQALVHPTATIHPTACLGAGSYVGAGTTIGAETVLFPGVYLGDSVTVGRGCLLYPQVVVLDRGVLGDRVILHPGVVIGGDGFGFTSTPQGQLKVPQVGRVVLEDDVEIGANSTVDRATLRETRIGRGSKLDNLVMIGHNVQMGQDCLVVSQSGIGGSTKLGDRIIVAAQSGIASMTHIEIGADSVIYGRAGVHKSFPSGSQIAGFPAQDRLRERRQQVSLTKVPELLKEMRELQKRVQDLEQAQGIPRTPQA
ncbi:UDP-3-O-(3-hydroxymyristoyl)glucosamine N-acyltransferase [Candidatus Cyanaurora vandensis]|uniref:UDP-3-O-(3-hydroxymyristoyl)glucosamine N-acyltransferase n=1 Tax=Candidatus Cyanaurora vandensis TaxID=2714958 RepID=UPI002580066E|nr:UDP-3-O-(3-hydroxymyristoyl)glucosamine N-acyltransferase [Candidatus Cyanaurora vandensis]